MDISRIKMYSITLSYTVCWISAMTMIAVETLKEKKNVMKLIIGGIIIPLVYMDGNNEIKARQ